VLAREELHAEHIAVERDRALEIAHAQHGVEDAHGAHLTSSRYNRCMLLAAIVVGAVALYYFGVRAAVWAAGATLVLSVIALVAPRWALAINAFIAAGTFALWRIGSKRQRPPDAVIAVRLVREALKRAWSTVRALWGGGGGGEPR